MEDFKNEENTDSEEDKIEISHKQAVQSDNKVKMESNKEKHTCEECGKSFRLASGLRTHSIKHGKKLKCDVCAIEFSCKLLLLHQFMGIYNINDFSNETFKSSFKNTCRLQTTRL